RKHPFSSPASALMEPTDRRTPRAQRPVSPRCPERVTVGFHLQIFFVATIPITFSKRSVSSLRPARREPTSWIFISFWWGNERAVVVLAPLSSVAKSISSHWLCCRSWNQVHPTEFLFQVRSGYYERHRSGFEIQFDALGLPNCEGRPWAVRFSLQQADLVATGGALLLHRRLPGCRDRNRLR